MIIIANNDEEEASAWAALDVIDNLRNGRTMYPTRPNTQDTPSVKTRWPHDWYL